MKAFFIIFLLLPSLLFAQNKTDAYTIYSQYLKLYKIQQSLIRKLVVKESTEYGRKYGDGDINSVLEIFRASLKGDESMLYSNNYQQFAAIVKKDSLWLSLIDKLELKMKNEFQINDQFSKDINVSMLSNSAYDNYFNGKDFRKDWAKYYKSYPKSLLIELSEIVSDDKRAVFYFSGKCGGLCGKGELVLFYKENSEWKFLQTLLIWQS